MSGKGKKPGKQTGVPEGFKFVKALTNEDGWHYLTYTKGIEAINNLGEQVKALRHQAKVMRAAGERLTERADELGELVDEKVKRLQAEQQVWQNQHGLFAAELDLPPGCRVQEDTEGDRFVVIRPVEEN